MLLIMEYVKVKYVLEVPKLSRACKLKEVLSGYETSNDSKGKGEGGED